MEFNQQHHLVNSDHGCGYGQDELQRDLETWNAELEGCIGEESGGGIAGEEKRRLQVRPTQQPKQIPQGDHWGSQILIGISLGKSCKDA